MMSIMPIVILVVGVLVLSSFISVKVVRFSYKDFNDPRVQELRKRDPILDIKLALYGGVTSSMKSIDEVMANSRFYSIVLEYFHNSLAAKSLLESVLKAENRLVAILHKSDIWWYWTYHVTFNGDKAAMMRSILGGDTQLFADFEELKTSLVKFKEEYEKLTGTVVDERRQDEDKQRDSIQTGN